MSAFASELTQTVPLPFDPPHSVTIRALTGDEFDRALDRFDIVLSRYQQKGAIQIVEDGTDADQSAERGQAIGEALRADPLNLFNPHKVVAAGLTSWSYPKKTVKQHVTGLTTEAVEFIAREVLRLTRPALFQTPEEAAEAQKND